MACCICSVSVQSCSSPNVSNRKMDFPLALVCDCPCERAKIRIAPEMVAVEKINRNMGCSSSPPRDPTALVHQLDAEGRCVQLENCRAFSPSAIDLKFLGGTAGQISCFCNTRENWGGDPTNRYFCNTPLNMSGSKILKKSVLLL